MCSDSPFAMVPWRCTWGIVNFSLVLQLVCSSCYVGPHDSICISRTLCCLSIPCMRAHRADSKLEAIHSTGSTCCSRFSHQKHECRGRIMEKGKLSPCIAVCWELLLLYGVYIFPAWGQSYQTNQWFNCIILDRMIILLCQEIPNHSECFAAALSSCRAYCCWNCLTCKMSIAETLGV
jgi:hypothetical protein